MTETSTPAGDLDTASMRAEADQLNASVRDDNRSLIERTRKAAQLAWEADLIDDAAMALAELNGARSALTRLEEAAQDAIEAERAAEDRLRADERHLARRRAEQQKGEAEYAAVEVQEQLADRVSTSERVVAAGRAVVGNARADRERAQAALAEREAHVAELDCEHAEAARKAADPGPAPNLPGLVPGVARASDMDDEQRQLVGLVAILAHQADSGPDPSAGSGARSERGAMAGQDPRTFRHMIHRGNHVVVPSDWRGGAR